VSFLLLLFNILSLGTASVTTLKVPGAMAAITDRVMGGEFEKKVDKALEAARKLLGTTRTLSYPSQTHHHYDDKFGLVELATQAALLQFESTLAVAVAPAAWAVHRTTLEGWAGGGEVVSLRIEGSVQCEFVKTTQVIIYGHL
jgi:hypothetical protein